MAGDPTPSSDLDPPHIDPGPNTPLESPHRATNQGKSSSPYVTRDLTRGSIRRNLWFLAWPQVAEGYMAIATQLADLIWAGRLGFQAVAGLGVAQIWVMLILTSRMGLDAAMRSMIARAVGARDLNYANHVLLQSISLMAVYVVAVVALGLALTEPMLRILGLDEAVVAQAADYMRVQFFSVGFIALQSLSGGALQASGDSLTPLKAETVARVVHLSLSPLLLFGWLGLPEMGLAGAATAMLVARFVGASLNFSALLRGTSRLHLSFRGYRVDLALVRRLVYLGLPATVTHTQRGMAQLVMLAVVAPFGAAAVAAFSASRRAETVANITSRGFGRAAGALAGQNLGAGHSTRANSAIRWSMVYVAATALTMAVLLLVFRGQLASFINSEPRFVELASGWLVVLAIGFVPISLVQLFTAAFNTSGQTVAPMVVTVATMWGFEIPLAIALANLTGLGQYGVPWAIAAGATLRLILFAWYFGRGTWMRTGVI